MQEQEQDHVEKVTKIYMVLMFVMIGILVGRLAWLQVVQSDFYTSRADSQRTRLMTITATRGDIISADGTVLVTDRPSYQITLEYLSVRKDGDFDREKLALLASLLDDPEITAESLEETCKANRGFLYKPIVIKKNLDIDTVSRIEAHRSDLPGVTISSTPERNYLMESLAGHILGYIGEISQTELDSQEENEDGSVRYKMGDYVGKAGLERYYDLELRGIDGYQQVEVNAGGKPVSESKTVDPIAGNSLILTIDMNLQQTLENAMDSTIQYLQNQSRSDKAGAGAAVLMNCKTGEVLAMASRPEDNIGQQNRAIQGRYVPGSTFKPVTAVAALETGVVNDRETIYNPGRYWIAPYIKTTAPVGYYSLYNAMAKSDNVYFQEIGRRAGIDAIAQYGKALGLEGPTGIDLAYESTGSRAYDGLPTQEKREAYQTLAAKNSDAMWDAKLEAAKAEYEKNYAAAATEEEKKKIQKKYNSTKATLESDKLINHKWLSEWHAADTFNVAIGQGRQNYTPLQLAVYVSAIANGGSVLQPYIVKEIRNSSGELVRENTTIVRQESGISAETLTKVRNAMCNVTKSGGGAYSLFADFPASIPVAAKTGTAQPGRSGYIVGTKQYYDGLFVCFAPANDPEIAFACVMEYGYSGGGSAGKVAREVLREYFGLNSKE